MRRDIISDLSRIVHPLPPHPGSGASGHDLEGWSHWAEEISEQQHRLQENLEGAWDNEDADPLLGEIAAAREAMLAAEKLMRQLLAYGREFVGPRPYKLDDLARAAGMSISGVRTAYDNDEVTEVGHLIGAKSQHLDGGPVSPSPAGEPA